MAKSKRPASSEPLLHQRIYRGLKEAVLRGELKPGEVLSEVELAGRWDVSRTPIREAIRQLEQEGLIRWSPRLGAMVAGITVASVRDLYVVREVLEALCARLVAERAEPADLASFVAVASAIEQAQDAVDLTTAIELDDDLHRKMAASSRNRVLEAQLGRVLDRVMMARMMVRRAPGRLRDIVREHSELLDALASRDAELASRLAAAHVRNSRVRLMETLQSSSVDGL